MENTKKGVVIPLDAEWSDMGSWKSVWENSNKDKDGNFRNGRVISKKTQNCYLSSESKLLIGLGINNLVIIDADDVQCDHGSTIGQLNPTEIHYIRSRGLTEKEARVLLSFGFIDEVLSTMVDVKARDGVVALIKQVIQDLSDYEPVKSFV